jgi:hypothetical protein
VARTLLIESTYALTENELGLLKWPAGAERKSGRDVGSSPTLGISFCGHGLNDGTVDVACSSVLVNLDVLHLLARIVQYVFHGRKYEQI